MKKLFYILFLIINCQLSIINIVAQNYAPKDYYLIDSLDLDNLSEGHKIIIDSCLNVFHQSKQDTNKLQSLNFIVDEVYNDDVWPKYNDFKLLMLEKLIVESDTSKLQKAYKYERFISLYNRAYYYENKGDFNNALKHYLIELKAAKKIGNAETADALNSLGFFYKKYGNISEALNYYHESLTMYEKTDDKRGEARALNNIGVIYMLQGSIAQCLEKFYKSLEIRKEIQNKFGIAESYNNIGYIYHFYGDPNCQEKNDSCYKVGMLNALKYYQKSLIIREEINDKNQIAMSLNNIGSIYKDFGDPSCTSDPNECRKQSLLKALEYLQKCLKLRTETNNYIGVSIAENNIGDTYLKMKDTLNAIKHVSYSLKISQRQGSVEQIRNSSRVLSDIYEAQNKFEPALDLFKLHITMRDSMNNEETQKAAAKQQAQYEYEKQKAIDDKEHEKQLAIEQEAKEKQTILTYTTGGGLGLVGIFLLIVFNRLKVTRKQKNIIEEQKQEVEHQKEVVEQAHSELEEKNKEILDSINYAKRIQNAILPPQKVVKEYLQQSFILYKPKDIVAGDFYWMETVDSSLEGGLKEGENHSSNSPQGEKTILFAACDCTGHGVPGAMVSVVCNNGLNRSVREYGLTDPGKILDKTREIVVEEFRAGWQAGEKSEEEVKDGMDIALCSLSVGSNQQTVLKYAGAHNPLWIIRNGELLETKANKQPIGKFDNPEPYTTHTIELQKGDSVYIFSDGYADQFGGEKGKKLKTANFKKLLLSIQNENMQKQKEIIDEAFESWKGNLEQLDDVCVIGVRI